MGEINAVLDTCVLLPSPIYNTLLFIAGHHVYTPLWTDRILAELARNMLNPANPRYRKTPEQVEIAYSEWPPRSGRALISIATASTTDR